MTLRDRFRSGVGRVFTSFDSMATSITYRMATGDATYNVTTGAVATPTVSLALRALIMPVKDKSIDGSAIRIGDRQVLINRPLAESAATAVGQTFTPSVADRVGVAGVDWHVTNVREDAAQALVVLNCRAPE